MSPRSCLTVYWTLAEAVEGWDGPASLDWLSDEEKDSLASLTFPKRRREWLFGRLTAKKLLLGILANLTGIRPGQITIANETEGAPIVLLNGQKLDLCLSISHRDRLAFCALNSGRDAVLGADIERIEPREEAFASDYFTCGEQDLLAGTASIERHQRVTLIWSAKEAALKALRKGLRLDTRSVEIHTIAEVQEGRGSFEVRSTLDAEGAWRGWWQRRGEYVLTLALLGSGEMTKDAVLAQIE